MLVRLKKRGEFPDNSHSGMEFVKPTVQSAYAHSTWRGLIIEVEKLPIHWPCGGEVFHVTDSRLVRICDYVAICSHYLIDDLDAYESDSADEQAEIGDLATVAIPQTVKVRP